MVLEKLRAISNICAVFLICMLISLFFVFRLIWVLALYFSIHFALCEMFIVVFFYWIFYTYFVKHVFVDGSCHDKSVTERDAFSDEEDADEEDSGI